MVSSVLTITTSIQWTPSTLETNQSVLIEGVASFQGETFYFGSFPSGLNTGGWPSFQGSRLKGVHCNLPPGYLFGCLKQKAAK